MKKNYEKTKSEVLAAFDKLVAEEKNSDPTRFLFLSRYYYAKKIALDEDIPTRSESYIYKIIKNRFLN